MQKAKELDGQAGIEVFVEQETKVHTEELWREAVQVLLYGGQYIGIHPGQDHHPRWVTTP
jgi:hypothetical protein